ncbi:preprotein translocase subunit SecA [Staphylococcus aureus]|uniref:preprotein translocase subunit SecA n=1 Tax=Staphylococcus aureus TaxID=1280 RepID=UPI000E3EAC20|nr:DEAD/DEAH box helicase [Staphylococcus aureus]GBV38057.1 sec family Type I general secretory pathway protein SecA [Staphylococcus aureus]
MKHKLDVTINELRLKSIRKIVKRINTWSDEVKSYSDDALKQKTIEFKERLASGVDTLDTLLPEAYAVAREASWRVLGMYPKEVQLIGAIVLHEGNIAEMQTGEGKTLTATMPLYLNALSGKGTYLITTNDYLAKRDFEEMQPLYEWLGLTASLGFVDIVDYEYQKGEKRNIYEHDIIYTTNGRLGFDYLIDNLADSAEGKFLPQLNYGIIDEVDSIILDAAQTPLVISGAPRLQSNLFHIVKEFVDTLIEDVHFKMKKTKKEIWLLNQGIEAKEGMEVSTDKSVMATITFQNLFKLFESFSGMTATGKLGESEFFDLYSKIVVQVPTDKAIQRIDEPDKVFRSVDEKNIAMIHDIVELHETGRPVLLITRTAEAAEYFSKVLFQMDIPNNLLIAQNVAKEAQMIAEAGQIGSMTVATSMAGRGTDIKLGEGVEALGGLAVIIHEHMENSRVDRQLRGRSGRQGDPGSSCIYISLDDYLVKRWSDSNLAENNQLYSLDAQRLSQSNLFNRKVKQIVVKAQRISEEQGVKAREMANEFEKSISIQRDLVYEERNRVLEIDDAENQDFKALAKDVFEMFVNEEKVLTKSRVVEYIYQNLSFQFNKDVACVNFKDKQAVVTFLLEQFEKQLALNRKNMQSAYYYNIFVQKVFLKAIDSCWLEQVDYLQQLKASVNQRQNGQRNAIFEYHRVALDSFEVMTRNIKKRMVKNICQSMITFDKEGMPVIHFP